MENALIAAAFGCIGGLIRSSIGLLKAHARKDKIKVGFILRTMRLSAMSGTLIGAIISFSPLVSFIAGYVGSDLLEGAYTSFLRTKVGKKHFSL